ncbi:hypothetical protein CDD80_773 [Ophiocordyceps camponoti-rufipedis]|uniref:Uncharacterized protein n=1 Tax=Ophiocordyceps camponoti-rufipedis TaxID=2004952 RepID=A0A2C5YIQ4_9HYPO|nr:hypothetical protein CDD80_773 [Ophiocordyceps camponoti-rufipedis]
MAEPTPDPTSNPPKPIHSLVLDTGPLIKNDPPVSVLLSKAEALYTIPSVLAEIRDQATRSRVETTLRPFLTVRTPRAESFRFVQGFARKTGDLAVLSRPDLDVLALAYELESLRMNLNLVTPSLARITQLKSWILRCHGCFATTKQMDRQFCPSCGQPTLLRASCSTDQHGVFTVHLKKNFQWNKRGNVYSAGRTGGGVG